MPSAHVTGRQSAVTGQAPSVPGGDRRVARLALVDDAVAARRRAVAVGIRTVVAGAGRAAVVERRRFADLLVAAAHGAVAARAAVARAGDVVVARQRAAAGIARRDRGVASLAWIDAPVAAARVGWRHAAVVVSRFRRRRCRRRRRSRGARRPSGARPGCDRDRSAATGARPSCRRHRRRAPRC